MSFLQDTASEILYPVLPFFVTGVLGAPPAVLGLIEGLADGTASVMKAASGRLADLRHRRPLVAGGYGISALGKTLLALAGAWPMVLAARFTDRVGKGLRGPPRDAIIADDTTPANRGRAFGFHRAADTAGAVIGPLLALGGYELLDHRLRPLLWVAVVPAVCSVLLVFLLREPSATTPRTRRVDLHEAERLPAPYWRVVGVLGLFGLVNFPDALLLLRLHDIGFSVAAVIAIFWAVSEGSTNAILGAAGLTALAMGAWWALLNWTPAIVSISNGILEISRGSAADSWDLAHEETDLTYSGKPASRSWKATLTGNDGKKHVITRSAVDPEQFVEIVEHYRTR